MGSYFGKGIRAANGEIIKGPATAGADGDFFVSGGDGQPMQSLDSEASDRSLGYLHTHADRHRT